MAQVIKAFLFAILILATGLPETSHAQSGNRALQEQAAERARQAQAAAAAARDREREAQARRAREQAATNDNRRPSQTSAANDNRRQSNFPNSVPTERLRFEAKPRLGSSFSQPALRPVPPGTTFSSNGVGKPARPPTAAEARRGFTGRVTEDGRALVKFQGRIYVVPASRIGVFPRHTLNNNNSTSSAKWSTQKQGAIASDIQRLVGTPPGGTGNGGTSGGGGSGGGRSPANDNAANDNWVPKFPTSKHKLQYNNAVMVARSSSTPVLVIGRHPNYLLAAFYGKSNSFFMNSLDWRTAEGGFRRANPEATDARVAEHMFETYNKKYIDEHLSKGGRVVLASPYEEMRDAPSYSQMEIRHLESHGYKITSDGTEMTK